MACTLSNKSAKNLSKRTVLLQLIIKNVVTCFLEHSVYATRGHKTNVYLAKALKVCRRNSIIIRGPKYWKLLPNYIKTAPSLNIFKNRLNLHLHATSLT